MDTPTPAPEEIRERLALAIALQRHGRLDAAMEAYQEILRLDPRHPQVLYLLGLANQSAGNLHAALSYVIRAIQQRPDEGEFHLGLGLLYKSLNAAEAALEPLRNAARLLPRSPEPHLYLGDLHMDRGEVDAAITELRQALALNHACEDAHINLGLCMKAKGDPDLALICFREALRLNPNNPITWVNTAHTLLLQGRYTEGWRAYEWRMKLPETNRIHAWLPEGLPRWRGDPSQLEGKTLLILSEQGFGDNLQFLRYLPQLKALGGRILLSVPTALYPLLHDTPHAHQVVERGRIPELGGGFDHYVHLLDLPGLFHTTLETIPQNIPYVTPHEQHLPLWRERIRGEGCRIGLVWHGKPLHVGDPYRSRSCPLAALAPLGLVPGLTLFSLQHPGEDEMEREWGDLPENLSFINLAPYLSDFDQTAAALACLDGVITIDTATAHLAGAMGLPCWTLLPFAPDWRWGLNQDETPWYPGMRLFRQQHPGQWETPVEALALDLARFIAQRAAP